MILLILGLVVFATVHILIGWPGMRVKLDHRLGPWRVRLLVATGAIVGLLVMAKGYGAAQFYPLFSPLSFGREMASVLMPLAFILLVGAYLPSNIKRLTAHPMLWSVILWALSHVLVKGDVASVILFGGLGVYSILAIGLAWVRGVRASKDEIALKWDGLTVAIGLTLYGILLVLHPTLFGVSVFS